MGSGQDVFERIEKKYVLDAAQRDGVMEALACSHRIDSYGTATVTSLYLDTARCRLIERSLEKPLYKEKLRLRAYGADGGASLLRAFGGGSTRPLLSSREQAAPVFLEMKKKYCGVVYKRRIALPLAAACGFLEGLPWEEVRGRFPHFEDPLGQPEARSRQIAREIRALMDRSGSLSPSMAIACERTALEPLPEAAPRRGALRVTFDESIRALPLRREGCGWFPVLDGCRQVMEVKNRGPLDTSLARVFSQEGLYPGSFSKYGRAHRLFQSEGFPRKEERCA